MSLGRTESDVMSGNGQITYATDGSDFRGAVKHHYIAALTRYAKWLAIFASMFFLVPVWGVDFLWPVAGVGAIGTLAVLFLLGSAVARTWKCSRIFRTYPFEFRGPVEMVQKKGNGSLILKVGEVDTEGLPTVTAIDPLARPGWPRGMADGFWFAGDDAFGGAALVPGTGELLFMQPREWDLMAERRASVGKERIKRARRAGIKRRFPIG